MLDTGRDELDLEKRDGVLWPELDARAGVGLLGGGVREALVACVRLCACPLLCHLRFGEDWPGRLLTPLLSSTGAISGEV